RLKAYGEAMRAITSREENAHWFLLELQPKLEELTITGFSFPEREKAELEYAAAERRVAENPGTDAVLVSVDSVSALKKAYPNYFADTRMFLALMNQALTGRRKQIRLSPLKVQTAFQQPLQGRLDIE